MRRKCGMSHFSTVARNLFLGTMELLSGPSNARVPFAKWVLQAKHIRTAWAFVPNAVLPTHIMMNLAVRIAGRPGVGTV